jgi:hypothetical protein
MSWKDQLKKDSIPWLLESDNITVRHLALRDLLGLSAEDAELKKARKQAHKDIYVQKVLSKMEPEGYWMRQDVGYGPKYKSTVWAVMLLAQLGASALEDKRIRQACKYVIEHTLTAGGQFTAINTGSPSGNIDCLQGNLCWALMQLGYEHPRLESAYEWMARAVTGAGIAPNTDKHAPVRYYAYKCGPNFACGANNKLPCAWGGTKVMLAFGKLPAEQRTPLIKKAIQQGADFLLGVDPATADYPNGINDHPNRSWWKFGFPVFYVTDILQIAEALVGLGYGRDKRLSNAMNLIREKQDEAGRWLLEYDYNGKTWGNFGKKNQPSKWVTLRALRALKTV